jgi:hypothetical protein
MMDPNVWDVTALRRLLCWANESQQQREERRTIYASSASHAHPLMPHRVVREEREEQRVRDAAPTEYRVMYHTPSVNECEQLFALEDTRGL